MEYFPTKYEEIIERIRSYDPTHYAETRNYRDGRVSRLSPYISRGVISTGFLYRHFTLERGIHWKNIHKFIQELAWREFFQRVWQELGQLERDIRNQQDKVHHLQVPSAMMEASTGIEAVDQSLESFYRSGYLHNHMRMYIASISCNVGGAHWLKPARWMYYHLLDADWGSNALSWQWVAGTFSYRKYYANQENINRFFGSSQRHTFLDMDYEQLMDSEPPEVLLKVAEPPDQTQLPAFMEPDINESLPVLIYDFYHLDPLWKRDISANRILLLEPSFFKRYPVSANTLQFLLELAQNIDDIQLFTGEFNALKSRYPQLDFYFREHPAHRHYEGIVEERDWIFPDMRGYHPSFSKFWKQAVKAL